VRAQADGEDLPLVYTLLHKAADRCVLAKFRAPLGSRLRYLISGSAPLSPSMLEFFHAIGLPVFEAYGLSEDIVPVAMNTAPAFRLGSVGRPLLKDSVILSGSSEILVRGPGLFNGYYRSDTNAPLYTEDGFYRTGDFGHIDDEGLFFLGGREADMIKTSTRQKTLAAANRGRLKDIPYIDQAVVFGQSRKCLSGLLTLDWKLLSKTLNLAGCRSYAQGPEALTAAAKQRVAGDIAACTAALAEHEKPAGFLILRSGFSVAGGELTSNLKLKRSEINKKYAQVPRPAVPRTSKRTQARAARTWFMSTATCAWPTRRSAPAHSPESAPL